MKRCNSCMRTFFDEDMFLIALDPSPSGITHLPHGEEIYGFCPYCGDDSCDDFDLADSLDLEDGREENEALITYKGASTKTLHLYVDDDGELQAEWLKKDTAGAIVATGPVHQARQSIEECA